MNLAVQAQKFAESRCPLNAGAEAGREGMLLGMAAAEISSPVSLLADAAEEMTFALHEHSMEQEADLKEMAEEHTSEERRDRSKKYHELMKQNTGKIHRLEAMQDYLSSRQERRDAAREMMRYFTNPAELFAALGFILQVFDDEASSSSGSAAEEKRIQATNVQRMMDELEDEYGSEIHATILGALEAQQYESIASVEALSELYTDTVCRFAGVKEVFGFIRNEYGEAGFDRAMDYLFGTLGADMASDIPSMGKTHLENVYGNLDRVRLLQNACIQCAALLSRWENEQGVPNAHENLPPLRMAGRLIDLNEVNYLGAMHIEGLMPEIIPRNPEHEVLLLQDILATIRTLPVRLFMDEQGRMKVLAAAQQAVDKAIEREDAWLAGGLA